LQQEEKIIKPTKRHVKKNIGTAGPFPVQGKPK